MLYRAGHSPLCHSRTACVAHTQRVEAAVAITDDEPLKGLSRLSGAFAHSDSLLRRLVSFKAAGELLVVGAMFIALYLTSTYSFLLFHSIAEVHSVIIGASMFVLVWNSRHNLESSYLVFLGTAYLFVSGIDFIHALAYKGMGVFMGYDSDLSTQLWIAARYLQSLSLLASPILLYRRLSVAPVMLGYVALTGLLFAAVFSGVFPTCYVEGMGLTPFKIVSEYVICLILLGAVALLLRNRDEFDDDVLRWLVVSLLLTICSELCFTFHMSVYGFSNTLGHLLKILAFSFVYKAIVEVGIEKPHRLLFRNLKQSESALRQVLQEVQRLAVTDSLTGLCNRRQFFELSEREFIRARRYDRPLSAIMLDIDHFKQVNDTHGHAVGDRVLQRVAEVCHRETRGIDVLGRYGGEEFAIMLPECGLDTAVKVAQRLRQSLSEMKTQTEAGPVKVTASFGVASLADRSMTLDALLSAADAALYRAKRNGRDCVCSA